MARHRACRGLLFLVDSLHRIKSLEWVGAFYQPALPGATSYYGRWSATKVALQHFMDQGLLPGRRYAIIEEMSEPNKRIFDGKIFGKVIVKASKANRIKHIGFSSKKTR